MQSYSRTLSKESTLNAIDKAFFYWSQESDLSFRRVDDLRQKADLIIDFTDKDHGDSAPFDGEGKLLFYFSQIFFVYI